MKKQGKRSKKKHLSKEAFRNIRYKQHMWRVYKHTGKDQDYEVYKEALNAATDKVRKSKRNFELKLAQNIKSDSKSLYAYVRSKQNVRDKVGPLQDNAGNIITEGFLMAEELYMHLSSVFTREDTSSLPVPETKFNGAIITDHMMDFLIKHKLINPSQHGFLKARSCLTHLLCFFEEITKWVDEGSQVSIWISRKQLTERFLVGDQF